jgi:hypothetical protein
MMKSFTVHADMFNRILKFSVLHVRNQGVSVVTFLGQTMPSGATWSHPNNNMSVMSEERLVVQFENQDPNLNCLVVNYFT